MRLPLECVVAATIVLFLRIPLVAALQLQIPFFGPALQEQQHLQLKSIYYRTPESVVFRNAVGTESTDDPLTLKPVWQRIYRPRDTDKLLQMHEQGSLMRWPLLVNNGSFAAPSAGGTNIPGTYAWELVPDVTHRPSILSLAIMTNNAYTHVDKNDTSDWYPLDPSWNVNSSFGWDSDGLRGHVFGNADNSLLVISFKGTSAGLWTGGPTGEKDKRNDNMLFSCCCARISRAWRTVCDCYTGRDYQCDAHCLEDALLETELYYDHALEIYKHVSDRYPEATIWLTGHSLGGALASLVGQTFGVPTVTFESPGDRLASRRLHLPHPPGAAGMPIWHFGHTADPLFVGVCTGPFSVCWYGGFAMETRCHAGKVCVWDTVNDKGWRVDIRSHQVQDVIENILKKPEEFPLPECIPESDDCDDCGLWQFTDDRDR